MSYNTTPTTPTVGSDPMSPGQERTWAMLSHAIPAVATVLSAGFLGFVASLVIYLAYRDRGPFVRQAAANSLNVQLTTLVVLIATAIIWIPLLFLGVGFVIYGAIFAVAVVLHLVAALRVNEGQWYKPPMTIGFVK